MMRLYDIHAVLAQLENISPKQIVFIAAFYLTHIAVLLFVVRTLVIYISRKIGVNYPTFHSRWPRVPWRFFYKIWSAIDIFYERLFQIGKRRTAGFASVLSVMCLVFNKPDMIHLGRVYAFGFGLLQSVAIKASKHVFIIAMTGAGKTVSIISMLSTWTNSVFLIDPKGQVTYALARLDWRTWFVIDPYNITPFKSACFNAFDCLVDAVERDGENAAVLWASRISFALITTPSGARSPYFYDVARTALSGIILHVYTSYPKDCWHLPFVRKLIVEGCKIYNDDGGEETKGNEAHDLLLHMMAKNTAFGGAISGASAALMKAGGETGGNLWSTLQDQTRFLDLPAVCEILKETTLPLSELKTRKDVVLSFTAPLLSIKQELAPLARLLTNMISYTFEAVKEMNGTCLSMIDELPSQGYNETFLTTLAIGRSQGQLLVGVAQNMGQMKSVYPKDYGTFIGEADAVFWMASAHTETIEMLSRILGKRTIIEKDRYSGRKNYRDVDLMDADQVHRFLSPKSQNLIITRAGERPLKLKNDPYFKALPVWRYAADPDHKETILRRIARGLFGRRRYPNENNRKQ